jgi:HAD superfamily hydrolase (TIGR01509 family)
MNKLIKTHLNSITNRQTVDNIKETTKNHYQAIIFDLDGTIIDTEHIWRRATKELLHQRGICISPELELELQQKLCGLALSQSCTFIKNHFSLPDALSVLVDEKALRANTLYGVEVKFVEGFLDFYAKVRANNLKSGVATNAHDDTVAVTDRALGLTSLFGEHIYPISRVNNIGKPDPAIYLHAAQKLGVNPENCIAIEDSAHGLAAAKKAGMLCIGINTAKDRTRLTQAHHVIETYNEINLDLLLKRIV